MSPREAPTEVLSADVPSNLEQYDAFGHGDYARALSGLLGRAEPPFTLGIFGDWGLGKTTVIAELGRKVRDGGDAFVLFDVWRYEGDALRRSFLKDAADQLKRQHALRRSYDPEVELRDLEVDVPVAEERFAFSWRSLIVSAIAAVGVGALAWLLFRTQTAFRVLETERTAAARTDVRDLLAILFAVTTFLSTFLPRIVRVDQRVTTLQRIDEPDRFLEKFEQLLDAVKTSRLVVAIDNLDRCSPELVDALLATIKTYLEPTANEQRATPAVLFVIAADDRALRRHLVARELEVWAPSAVNAEQEAERHVDEYLRKFFTATVPLRAMLDDDMRSYTDRQLNPFFEKYLPLSDADDSDTRQLRVQVRSQLTAMVASALRRNPRRVKQFVNTLETRLTLIAERERSGRINPPISDDVASIAKLVIIEEEWRHLYRQLQDDPSLLGKWQTDVLSQDVADADFSGFLRTTRDVQPANVSAIIELKQSEDERGLPDFGRFRDSVVLGNTAEARQIAERATAEQRVLYAQRLPPLLERELARGSVEAARNVLEAILADEPLGVGRSKIPVVLRQALADPHLRQQFWTVAPGRVFAALPLLTVPERRSVIEPYLNLGAIAANAPDRLSDVVGALETVLGDLEEGELSRLRTEIATEPHSTQHRDLFARLASRAPQLLTEGLVRSAHQNFVSRADITSGDFGMVVLGLDAQLIPDLDDAVLSSLASLLPQALTTPAAAERHLAAMARAVETAHHASAAALDGVLSALQTAFPQLMTLDPALASGVLNIVDDVAGTGRSSEAALPTFLQFFADSLAGYPEPLAAALSDRTAPLEPQLRDYVRNSLTRVAAATTDENLQTPALQAIASADESTAATGVASALRQMITQLGAIDVAKLGTAALGKREPGSEALSGALAIEARSVDVPNRTTWIRSIASLSEPIPDDAVAILRDLLVEMIDSESPSLIDSAVDSTTTLTTRSEFAATRVDVARASARSVVSNPFTPDRAGIVSFVLGQLDALDPSERQAVIVAVTDWLQNLPALRSTVAQLVTRLTGPSAAERQQLVQALLTAEASDGDPQVRAILLRAADQVRGQATSRASKTFVQRIETLRASSLDVDHEVVGMLDTTTSTEG